MDGLAVAGGDGAGRERGDGRPTSVAMERIVLLLVNSGYWHHVGRISVIMIHFL
ncbi:hypothetical protein [Kitasatospora sp. NPDC058218]|uniref:hypothetical protein n=1 Tax=Kitasatospora sp. NPDC058218 TaxID=3346385 RepID=UPI0036DD8B26